MKVLMANYPWQGGTVGFVEKALKKMGHEVAHIYFPNQKMERFYKLKLGQIKKMEGLYFMRLEVKYNKQVVQAALDQKPDLFLVLNEGNLFPESIVEIRRRTGAVMACWIGDNPFDSTRFRYLPLSLKFFHHLFLGDMIWEQNIRNVAPNSCRHHLVGAYCPDTFRPVKIDSKERQKYQCDLAFAGSAYGMKAEASYRTGVLAHFFNYNLKIWGGDGWDKYYKYFPQLKKIYQGSSLPFRELNKLYQVAAINLNIPNPQCFTTFQQRLFEIAACRGFQIVDYREDISKFFSQQEIASFKNINDLKEKVEYFLKNPQKREIFAQNLYNKVRGSHTYEKRMQEMLDHLN